MKKELGIFTLALVLCVGTMAMATISRMIPPKGWDAEGLVTLKCLENARVFEMSGTNGRIIFPGARAKKTLRH
jgi:hypothetical protein